MMNLGTVMRAVPRTGLLAVSDQLVVGASHHEAVLLDQAVWDALGSEGWAVRRQAAFDASLTLVTAIARRVGIDDGRELVDLAGEVFSTLGLGRLDFDVGPTGGTVTGSDLFFGRGFVERARGEVPARYPADAFAAGYAAAVASMAFPSDWGSFEAEETSCVARGDAACAFALSRRPSAPRTPHALTRADAEQLLPGEAGDEAELPTAGRVARDHLASLVATEHGIMRIGDARFALLPAVYRAQLEFDTLHLVEKRLPASTGVRAAPPGHLAGLFLELARESARAGAFQLLGSLYDSAPVRDELGPVPEDAGERAEQLAALATAMGWGHLTITELVPDVRLVLSVPLTPEAVYYAARHGGTPSSRLPGLQGVAAAIAWLSTRVDFGREPVGDELYLRLAQESPPLYVEETRSLLSGDRECEVVVEMGARV